MRRISFLLLFIVLAGCSKADISFVSHAKIKNVNMSAIKWSVAISKDDLVKVQSLQDVEYNVPLVSKNTLSKLLILDWADTGEEKTAEISPGVYDWIIVMDHNGDGRVDSYHGTLATNIKLRRYEFLGGHHYKIKVNEDESVEVKMD